MLWGFPKAFWCFAKVLYGVWFDGCIALCRELGIRVLGAI